MAGLNNYIKKAFKNYPDTTTKLSAENLNHLDNGIFDLDQAIGNALGTADISTIGNGTVKGAISTLNNDLGTADISTIGNGTVKGAISTLNNDLTELNEKVGGGMRCVGFGTSSGDTTITLSSFDYAPSSEDDYIVILDSGFISTGLSSMTGGAYVTAKTTTSFTINASHSPAGISVTIPYSYQIIALK